MYSGLLLGQGDVLTMFSSAKIYHAHWSIDGLWRCVVHAQQCGARVCDVNRGEGQGGNGRRWPSRGEENRKSII